MLEPASSKNLFKPSEREGGVPRFMGSAGEGSDRAWQLDFRAEAVRRKTGGVGIVLLSATPAKNSPLEFYNLIQYIDHDAWTRMGIRDPEQFIDRYLKIEIKDVIDTKLDVVKRSAVVGFLNLHELRDTLFRYCEFKTAEEVGLKLPSPRVNPPVQVRMNAEQERKYTAYVAEIEAILEGRTRASKNRVLGLLSRLALVSIHPKLDDGHDWRSAAKKEIDPHAPKLDACADRVLQIASCGHIIFADNLAIHQWMRRVLVARGMPEARIAVLNRETAKAPADRQRIAEEFNGNPDEGIEPKYDVVIANAIAYEGIDLQTRTCAIHHLDLPWEPATLQQRNGRGVRQGNRLATIEINYYFALRSADGLRFNLIDGKRGWMVELLQSQARETNNPGAQMEMTPEEMLLLISRNPEETAKRLAGVRAQREAAAREKRANEAARLLRAANTLFRRAELRADPDEAARLRREGDERLKALSTVDPEAWPWLGVASAVRERAMLVPELGRCPLYEGMVVNLPPRRAGYAPEIVEIGRIHGTKFGRREARTLRWQAVDYPDDLGDLRPEHLNGALPPEDDPTLIPQGADEIQHRVVNYVDLRALGWEWASEAWLTRAWAWYGANYRDALVEMVARNSYHRDRLLFAALDGRRLVLLRGGELRASHARLLAPGGAGWREFLALAGRSPYTTRDLSTVADAWFNRELPKELPRPEPSKEAP